MPTRAGRARGTVRRFPTWVTASASAAKRRPSPSAPPTAARSTASSTAATGSRCSCSCLRRPPRRPRRSRSSAPPPTPSGACAASCSASATPAAARSRRWPTVSRASPSRCCPTTAASLRRTAPSRRTARCGPWRSSSTAPARSCGPERARPRSSRLRWWPRSARSRAELSFGSALHGEDEKGSTREGATPMIVGQTMFSVLKGTEHRAEAALQELAGWVGDAPGHSSHRVLRSFGMSPLASALHDEGRESALGDVHFVFETQWESLEVHDEFYGGDQVQRVYGTLHSILTSGPFEVLYDSVVEQPRHHNVAI